MQNSRKRPRFDVFPIEHQLTLAAGCVKGERGLELDDDSALTAKQPLIDYALRLGDWTVC